MNDLQSMVMPNTAPLPPADLNTIAVLLDVDGTILDIAPTPREVVVPHSLRDTLAVIGPDPFFNSRIEQLAALTSCQMLPEQASKVALGPDDRGGKRSIA